MDTAPTALPDPPAPTGPSDARRWACHTAGLLLRPHDERACPRPVSQRSPTARIPTSGMVSPQAFSCSWHSCGRPLHLPPAWPGAQCLPATTGCWEACCLFDTPPTALRTDPPRGARSREPKPPRLYLPASAHPRTRATVRSAPGSRKPPRLPSAYARFAAGCARSRHRRALSPAAELRHSASAPTPLRFQRRAGEARSSGHPGGDRGCALPGGRSPPHLDPLVSGPVVTVQHLKFIGEAEQAFGVPHEQIALRIQAAVKFFDQPFLLGFIEIHHHVAAENNVIALRQIFRL